MSTYTFLITGCSSGLGHSIALAALKTGHAVIATARNPSLASQQYPQIASLGGIWLELDVTSPSTSAIVAEAVEKYRVNIIVNNAGYTLRGVLEDLSLEDYRSQFETNVFGAIAVTKGAVPYLRTYAPGTIVNISSTSGLTGSPGYTAYAASKFALEGFSESLSAELKDVGVRVLLVESGAFRTNFQGAAAGPIEMHQAYRGTAADEVIHNRSAQHGKQEGDPVKAGQAIVDAVTLTGAGKATQGLLRLPLAPGALARTEAKIEDLKDNLEAVRSIAESVVFAES